MNKISKYSTEAEAPFNSPEGGKYSPPLEWLGEANALKGHKSLAWGNALRYCRLRSGSPMTEEGKN